MNYENHDNYRFLNEKEKEALAKVANDPKNKLSPQVAAQFFTLFLQGYSTYEISKQNAAFGALGWGLVVKARLDYDWDTEREKYIKNLTEATRQSVEKSTLEAVQFSSDAIAVYHKLVGDKFRRFLQSGDPHHLDEFKDMSFKSYKDFIFLLQKLTGQDDPNKPKSIFTQNLEQNFINPDAEPSRHEGPVTANEAFSMLAMMVSKEDKKT